MYRPSTIQRHDKCLDQFIKLFNLVGPRNITARGESLKYIRDGVIKLETRTIGFDFEVRDDWSTAEMPYKSLSEIFPYDTLGQLERKFNNKKGIELTIQCSKDSQCFVVAWHKDFKEIVKVDRETDYSWKEHGKMRVTENFQIYHWTDIDKFKLWLNEALRKNLGFTSNDTSH